MPSVVDKRFRITIGKRARQELGIKPGDLAVEHVEDGRLVIRFVSGSCHHRPEPRATPIFLGARPGDPAGVVLP